MITIHAVIMSPTTLQRAFHRLSSEPTPMEKLFTCLDKGDVRKPENLTTHVTQYSS